MTDPDPSPCASSPAPSPPSPLLVPSWLTRPRDKLGQFLKYVWKVYGLPHELNLVKDERRRPTISTGRVVKGLLFTALFRLRSLNALEGELGRTPFQRLLGGRVTPGRKAFSADTVARVLDGLDHVGLRKILNHVLGKAERNKVFREGSYAARRAVTLDGWEPFCSYKRHCEHCLVRRVRQGETVVPQYYHCFVVALLLGPEIDVVLDLEPLRTADLRRAEGERTDCHDGESTAALRLIDRLHEVYGRFIDLFVLDALYPTGPVLTRLTAYGYGAVITVKKQTDEPLKEALALIAGQSPCRVWEDPDKSEHLEAWDVDDLETLDTFSGKVRVVRVEVRSTRTDEKRTWCAAVIGDRTRKLSVQAVHKLHRSRWHIENTGFNQWAQHWHLDHVFRHSPGAVVAVMLLWCLAFNLMQLFVYKRLRKPRVPRDPCKTLLALVAEMFADLARLHQPVPWELLFDTS